MKKFTETKFYKKLYAQIERTELEKINMERVLKEWKGLVESCNEVTFEKKAILFAQCIHRPQLKSPSQAVYPDFDEYDVDRSTDGVWVVSGYCDAPNSYGALTRAKFQIHMRDHGDCFEYVISEEKVHGIMITMAFVVLVLAGIICPIIVI